MVKSSGDKSRTKINYQKENDTVQNCFKNLLIVLLISYPPFAVADVVLQFEQVWDDGKVAPKIPVPQSVGSELIGEGYTDQTTNMEFVFVKGGCFQMGSNDIESYVKPVHEVCVDDYYIGKYEVTQNQYQQIVGSNPSNFKGGNRPVERVSWSDVMGFIRKLGWKYRLPTEAEWEYAARSGGKNQTFAGGEDLDTLGWHNRNSNAQTHSVGQKQANGLGLYDMSGNVWEWCNDWYSDNYYHQSPRNNPQGATSGSSRAFRGGGWAGNPGLARTAIRRGRSPDYRGSSLGFRLVLQSP